MAIFIHIAHVCYDRFLAKYKICIFEKVLGTFPDILMIRKTTQDAFRSLKATLDMSFDQINDKKTEQDAHLQKAKLDEVVNTVKPFKGRKFSSIVKQSQEKNC